MKRILCRMILMAAIPANGVAAAALNPPLDSIAQRAAACAACHGAQGRATAEGYFPRIAGKPEGYLFNQLENFRQGRRVNPAMTYMVAHLPDAYLKEIAGHFSSQLLPYPPPQRVTVSPAQIEQGRRLVTVGDAAKKLPACVACHGAGLAGVEPAIPGLLGLPRDYLIMQLSAWRQGTRRAADPDCMAHIARKLEPAELVAVAAWLSSQPIPDHYRAAPALRAPLPIACAGMP